MIVIFLWSVILKKLQLLFYMHMKQIPVLCNNLSQQLPFDLMDSLDMRSFQWRTIAVIHCEIARLLGTMDLRKSGLTVFTPPPCTNYRYVIDLKNSKMSIWMENCSNKKQWYCDVCVCDAWPKLHPFALVRRCKSDILPRDYVTSANTIPNASPVDYVKVNFMFASASRRQLRLTQVTWF